MNQIEEVGLDNVVILLIEKCKKQETSPSSQVYESLHTAATPARDIAVVSDSSYKQILSLKQASAFHGTPKRHLPSGTRRYKWGPL